MISPISSATRARYRVGRKLERQLYGDLLLVTLQMNHAMSIKNAVSNRQAARKIQAKTERSRDRSRNIVVVYAEYLSPEERCVRVIPERHASWINEAINPLSHRGELDPR